MDSQSHSHVGKINLKITARLALSLVITLVFVIVEVTAGVFSNSLALLSDAAHNITDVIALALTWWALRLASQPANQNKTFGYHRAGILAAFVNSITLAIIAIGIFYEAYQRVLNPSDVQVEVLIGVGSVAVVINVVTALLIRHGAEQDLNIRSAFLHLLADVYSTVGAVVAGVIIRFTNWNWLDPFASVLIGILIMWSGWKIVREAVEILMESTPKDIDMAALIQDITSIEGIHGVHDLHIWSLSQATRTLSAHIVTDDISISRGALIQKRVNDIVHQYYGVKHATLQLECNNYNCTTNLLYCGILMGNLSQER